MALCKNCGAQINDDDKFCPACGTPVENVSDSSAEQMNQSQQQAQDTQAQAQYSQPQAQYSQPQAQYSQPQAQYSQQQGQYNQQQGQSQAQYNQTQGQYNQTQGQYNQTQGQYNQTQGQYNQTQGQYNQQQGQFNQQNMNGQNPNNLNEKISSLMNTEDTTAEFDPMDIEQNKVMALFSYLGLLVLIPLFGAQNSKYARFHANQGVVLLALDVAYGVVKGILTGILKAIFPWKYTLGVLGGRGFIFGLINGVLNLVWVAIGILAILGIVNAVTGKAKKLPIIGGIQVLK